jgi:tetratricopeptide (TPR) repeat protein
MDQERYEEALEALEQARRLAPEWGEIYGLEALCHSSLGQEEKAERLWRRALALAPHDVALRWHYGVWLHAQGRLEEALEALLSVLEVQPRYAGEEGVYFVADCYRSLGRFREAENLLRHFGLEGDEGGGD